MFIIKKILNSATNAPEPIRLPTDSTQAYKFGTLLILKTGKLRNVGFDEMPTHIAGETLSAGEKQSILCYEISPDFLIRTIIEGSPTGIKAGDKVALGFDDVFADKVINDTEGGVATVADIRGTKKNGDYIYVMFK